MAKAGPSISRRAALTAAVALPIGAGAIAAAPDEKDRQFLDWQCELDRVEAIPSEGLSDHALDQFIDQAGALSQHIQMTRGVSPTIARIKLRLLRDHLEPGWRDLIADVAAVIGR